MQLGNLSSEQMDKLFQMAGGQLGINPEQLKEQIQSGKLDNITSRLTPQQAGQMNEMLKNPDAIKQLLSNPQVAGMLKNFTKGK